MFFRANFAVIFDAFWYDFLLDAEGFAYEGGRTHTTYAAMRTEYVKNTSLRETITRRESNLRRPKLKSIALTTRPKR